MARKAAFDDESVPDVEILLKRQVEFDVIGVRFASGVDATHQSSDCRVRSLLIEPVGLKVEAIIVRCGSRE